MRFSLLGKKQKNGKRRNQGRRNQGSLNFKPMNEQILKNFEKASTDLVEAFAEKQDLDFDFFIGDNPAEAVSFSCEITFSLANIYHDLKTNQSKGLIIEWFYENLEQYHKGNKEYINYVAWTMGKRYEASKKDKV